MLLILTVGTVSGRHLLADTAAQPLNQSIGTSNTVQLLSVQSQQQYGQLPPSSSRPGAEVAPRKQPGQSLPRALRQQYTDAIDVLSPELLEHLQPATGTAADIRAATAAVAAATYKDVEAKFVFPAPSVLEPDEAGESVVFLGEKFRLRR
jgi:hypothetical protein